MSSATRLPGAPGRGVRVRTVNQEAAEDYEREHKPEGDGDRRSAPPLSPDGSAGTDSESRRGGRPLSVERGRSLLPPPGRGRIAMAVLGVIAAAGIALSVVFGLEWSSANAARSAESAAAASAREVAVALTNFDPGTVAPDFQRVKSMSTGAFASQADKFFTTTVGKELSQAGAASRGRIDTLEVQSVTGSQASVFAVVSQTYLNDKQKTPINDTLRLLIGETNVNGSWLVSSVQVLQQP